MRQGMLFFVTVCALASSLRSDDSPAPQDSLTRWLGPQNWQRDVDGPVLELGTPGEFDDTHIFAPCAAQVGDRFLLWYSGSSRDVAHRVFALGLATSADGRDFRKSPENPVLSFADQRRSVLTPALLRGQDGACVREEGELRLWFAATDFAAAGGLHTLHESTSSDGITWSKPSAPQLENVYAPSILKLPDGYRLWYTDVSADPWIIRMADSHDGRDWSVRPEPVLTLDQTWEQTRLFYPYVLRTEDMFLMWYGSYWADHPNKTALGFAVSSDGIVWHKHPRNPVVRPDPARPWESHYTTSQSVVRLADGSFRMWYASRKAPPFVNKYFAIGTALWNGP